RADRESTWKFGSAKVFSIIMRSRQSFGIEYRQQGRHLIDVHASCIQSRGARHSLAFTLEQSLVATASHLSDATTMSWMVST
ncbi:hypothetical protein, partial [Mesorhizobium sp.]|uniref:hypothetical protein n=1 Tax=Mesorhizobium sp. TaxID=1871066 RepID=UPI0025F90998